MMMANMKQSTIIGQLSSPSSSLTGTPTNMTQNQSKRPSLQQRQHHPSSTIHNTATSKTTTPGSSYKIQQQKDNQSTASSSQFFLELNGSIYQDQLSKLLTRITAITNQPIDQQNLFEHVILMKAMTQSATESLLKARSNPGNALTLVSSFFHIHTNPHCYQQRKQRQMQFSLLNEDNILSVKGTHVDGEERNTIVSTSQQQKEQFNIAHHFDSDPITKSEVMKNIQESGQFIKFHYRKWKAIQHGPPEPFKGTPVNYRSILSVAVGKDVFGFLNTLGYLCVGEHVKEGYRIEFQGIRIDIFRLFETHDKQVSSKSLMFDGIWFVQLSAVVESGEINSQSVALTQFGECLHG